MAQIGGRPNAGGDTGDREQKSDLKSPKKVRYALRTEKENARGKDDPKGGGSVTGNSPDIKKADQSEQPNHPQLRAYVPMGQAAEREENEPWKKNPMFVVLSIKITKAEGTIRHFFK